jgi:ubiquinone/menaquinone biosynthesis C-methylase UbiE
MKNRFESLASEYDLFKLAVPHYDELQLVLARQIKKNYGNKNLKLIEIGSGTGVTTKNVLKNVNKVEIVSIDNNLEMLRQIDTSLEADERVRFRFKDALMFLKKIEENSVDGVFSAYTLHNFDKEYRKDVLKEIYRVLKPKGFFINADKYALEEDNQQKVELEWQLNMFRKFKKIDKEELCEKWTAHYLKDEEENLIMRENESIDLMKNIGFNKVNKIYREHMEAILVGIK